MVLSKTALKINQQADAPHRYTCYACYRGLCPSEVRRKSGLNPAPRKGARSMRRAMLLLVVTAATLVVASGVAFAVTKIGGPGDNTLYGTNNPDKLDGRAGDDTIYGLGGSDSSRGLGVRGYLVGGEGDDTIYGGTGDDDILGGRNFIYGGQEPGERGKDTLYGGKGDDFLTGDAGADVLYGNEGEDDLSDGEASGGAVDVLYGGTGDDFLNPINSPAGKDIVYCGGGFDFVVADRADVLHNCEEVFRD